MAHHTDDSFRYQSDFSLYDDDYTLQEDIDFSRDFEPLESETDFSQSYSSMRESARYEGNMDRSKASSRRGNTRAAKPPPGPPSFQGNSSISTIPSSEQDSCPADVKEVYAELQEINRKLKEEYKVLQDRTLNVKQREKLVAETESKLNHTIESEVQSRMSLREQELQLEIEKLENAFREKSRENKRLQENFNTLKSANDSLRKEMETLQSHHDKLEKQSQSLQARFLNLQRKADNDERKESAVPQDVSKSKPVAKRETREKLTKTRTNNEVMSILLEWVSEVHLRFAISDQPSKQPPCPTDFIQQKTVKILPQLVEILKEVANQNSAFVLPCLQFMYWSLLHLDQGKGHQKSALCSTLRRLGEELYRPRLARGLGEDTDRPTQALFFRSQDLTVRFLSTLIILKTISQVDHLAQVFDVLRSDLKTEPGKELFVHYQATPVILYHIKPSNKALMSSALDILLQLSMECEQLPAFLDSCSCESWFRVVANVWRSNQTDQKVQEKLSIILQKLSKIKSNRKYFEVFGLTTSCQELVRTLSSDQDAAFLSLNLKSILFNLNANKPSIAT